MTTRPNGPWASLPVLLVAAALAWQAGASNLALSAQQPISSPGVALFHEFEWRSIGPYLSGRTTSADATSTDPTVFYAAAGGGGLWKSANDGQTWQPIFDAQPVGAVAVSPSRPDVVFLGTGEGLDRADGIVGDGLYRSADAGRTWTHVGLTNARAVARIAIAPDNPDRLLVAAVAAPAMTDAVRGVFRSTDGGRTFTQVLAAAGDLFGATDLVIDPANANTAYAILAGMPGDGRQVATAGLFKSADGGATWRRIGDALPLAVHASDLSRVTLTLARARPGRLFLLLPAGANTMLYRSDDAGETWPIASPLGVPGTDRAGAQTAIAVHPADADEVYALGAGPSGLWISRDGGQRFSLTALTGVEESERLWIHPARPHVMLAWGAGGPRVSVDAGLTWTSSFTLPTATIARVAVDTAFPYRACGVQARGWAFCVPTRTDSGASTRRDWARLPDATGAIVPDPLDPEIVYAGQVTRYDRRTGQLTDVSPQGDIPGATTTASLAFSFDGRMLYYGTNMLWRLVTATQTWTAISPDLTRGASTSTSAANRPGTNTGSLAPQAGISAIGLSPSDIRTMWVGTTDGLVQRSRDAGLTWANITPGSLAASAAVLTIEVSHFDANSAYVVLQSVPGGDPQVLRTRDAGLTWTSIAPGLPRVPAHAVREDAFRRGLLFAATDAGVEVSFDDGDSWQALRLNMPATPVRDVLIKDADLVVATAGRGLWVLEDFSPMRQMTPDIARADAFVFRPAAATRARRAAASDAPSGEPSIPPAPSGVALHYMIGPTAAEAVSLEVIESATGTVLRRFASDADDPTSRIPATPGLHRVNWDLRTAPIAIPSAAPLPGVVVMPGVYQVRLVAGNRVLRQAISIRFDPRIRVANPDLQAQFTLSKSVQDKLRDLTAAWRAAPPASAAASTLAGAAYALIDLSRLLDRADGRPSASVQGTVATALARADAAMAAP